MLLLGYKLFQRDTSIAHRIDDFLCDKKNVTRLSGKRWAIAAQSSVTEFPVRFIKENSSNVGLVIGKVIFPDSDQPSATSNISSDLFRRVDAKALWGRYAASIVMKSEDVTLITDPLGYGDMFFAELSDRAGWVFSTCVEAVVALLGYKPSLDWTTLHSYISQSFPEHSGLDLIRTPFKGINRLGMGVKVLLGDRGARLKRVWKPESLVTQPRISDPAALRSTLVEVTRRWLPREEKVVIQLSGGIDSSALAWAMSESGLQVSAHHFDSKDFVATANEFYYAELVAKSLNISLVRIPYTENLPLTPCDVALPKPNFPTFSLLIAKQIATRIDMAQGATIAFGFGGDEIFNAFDYPFWSHDLLLERKIRASLDLIMSFCYRSTYPVPHVVKTLLQAEFARWTGFKRMSAVVGQLDDHTPSWLHDVPSEKGDSYRILDRTVRRVTVGAGRIQHIMRMSALPIEVGQLHHLYPGKFCFPFYSFPIVRSSLLASISSLVHADIDRPFIRNALRGQLPAPVVNRQGKGDYTGVWLAGIKKNFDHARELVADGRCAGIGIIEQESALRAVSLAASGLPDDLACLMRLMTVEKWLRMWNI